MHHPWRDLRDREDVTVFWRDMPGGLLGATNGRDIWMDRRQLQVERRCTLTHELVHLDLGHEECQDVKTEAMVRRITARRLITLDQLVEVARWALSLEEAADAMWVTPEVLADFIHSLAPAERAIVLSAVTAHP